VSSGPSAPESAGTRRTRRALLAVGASGALLAAAAALTWRGLSRSVYDADAALPVSDPDVVGLSGAMPYRRFGKTGLKVSEIGFGAWAIGGRAYGAVDRQAALRALARAEELGCNLVDTAMVYGDSELLLGEFLRGRRNRWLVATKYSFQSTGLEATLEQQLRRLGTDVIDLYQLHAPPADARVYEALYRARKAGKVRFIGVSVYSANDIDQLLGHSLDALQLPFSVLDPDPFLRRAPQLHASGLALLIRSSLKEGFLAGKFRRDATFPDRADQRHGWTAERIAATVDAVERFRFLEQDAGSMVRGAVAYPLSFPEVSTVLLGVKNEAQAQFDFGEIPGARLSTGTLRRIHEVQEQLDAGGRRTVRFLLKRLIGRA
jgi:myo-inositol catabolism protein IolS